MLSEYPPKEFDIFKTFRSQYTFQLARIHFPRPLARERISGRGSGANAGRTILFTKYFCSCARRQGANLYDGMYCQISDARAGDETSSALNLKIGKHA